MTTPVREEIRRAAQLDAGTLVSNYKIVEHNDLERHHALPAPLQRRASSRKSVGAAALALAGS